MHRRTSLIPVVLSAAMLMFGCGDDGASSKPVTGLEVSPDCMTLEISREVAVGATVSGGSSKAVKWYVNGVLGGNGEVGSITQANPATFTSPDAVPIPDTVIVRCVSAEDTSMRDSCIMVIQFTLVYVDGSGGNDESGSGGEIKPFKTIGRGLGAANSGMTVQVACGIYPEYDLDMKSGVTLRSETGDPDCVTIDAQQRGRIFDCDAVDSTGRIIGFTITGGRAKGSTQDACGGAIWCRSRSSPTVINCIFHDNMAYSYGGVVYVLGRSRPSFRNCTFYRNHADLRGGVMLAGTDCSPTFRSCTLSGNTSYSFASAIYLHHATMLTLENTIVAFGMEREGGAIYCQEPEDIVNLSCCVIYENATGDWVGCFADKLGLDGNISADPLFCDTLSGDFRLQSCSPCLPGNHPDAHDCGPIGAWGEGCPCK